MVGVTLSRGTQWLNLKATDREVVTITNAAAIGLTAAKVTAAGVVAVFIRLDLADIRWWDDGGVDPTASDGIPLLQTETLTLNQQQASQLRMFGQTATSAKAFVHYLSRISTT